MPNTNAKRSELSDANESNLYQIVEAFEKAWQTGKQPAIDDYLPADTSLRRIVLIKLVHIDLECRLKAGEKARIEVYLDLYPEIAKDAAIVVELAAWEYRLRRRNELDLTPEEYISRFPQFASEINRHIRLRENSTETPTPSHDPSDAKSSLSPGKIAPSSATPSDNELPERFGRYRVTAVLGSGGFGVVYRGYDDELQRDVAIKVPHWKRIARPEDAEAYLAEARIVAGLDHPHVVSVFDLGRTADGLCYIVSKFIDGSDLAQKIKNNQPTFGEATELVATIAEALHYAHRKSLVHRDIKPANILIDTSDKPYVADFGLALKEEDFGKGANFAGTPSYMSPEQARGEGHRVDGRSDIFSLGVVFYELLTGRRPFRAEAQTELLEQIANVEARPPRQVDDSVPKELERICLKALSKRASERYTTAKDMADDLRHFLASASVEEKATHSFKPVDDAAASTPVPGPTPTSDQRPIKIVPKGLRSFDAHDADFFLELLPGPRDRDGLPDGIRFWKTRIEEKDSDNTFAAGLIYGPSGCGKSSLVKAGLLPRLSADVIAVYVESTAEETETRLLNGMRKRCPALPSNLSLTATLAALRRGQGIPAGKKVVIVLDQFEQWLHAKKDVENTELVQALRQCDAWHVQCIVMVRDDFWLAVSRFLRDLEIRLVEGQNSALTDLFPIRHAEKVLAAFGRAFSALPDAAGEVSKEQKQFLEQAVSGLAQEGKVVPVRLALFAEMLKGKSWTPTTLKEVGGTEGVGVTFLEETFSAATAPPEHRYHQKAARAVLKALLPESGIDIKGHMRSRGELLEASGYAGRPKEFASLIQILDGEIRLITPTDLEGKEEGSAPQVQTGAKYYQLTHDYLVPSLREWLTRKQKETRRGRAELLLADRAAVWNARPENRQLPSLLQWFSIRWWTQKKRWTPPQHKMMAKASQVHAMRAAVVAVLLIATTITGLAIQNQFVEQDANSAAVLVQRLFDAPIDRVPEIIKQMEPYSALTTPLLKDEKEKSANDSPKQLYASLALLPSDSGQVDYLYESLLKGEPQEVVVIREALSDHKSVLTEPLWTFLENPKNAQAERFHAACALAAFAPDDLRWKKVSGDVAAVLMPQRPVVIDQRTDALKGARKWLLPPLADFLVDEKRSVSERGSIATIYGSYAIDTPDGYARLEKQLDEHGTPMLRQASIGTALMVMGKSEKVWRLLKHSADPTSRSFLMATVAPAGVDPKILLTRLEYEKEVSVKRAILLSLGEFGLDRLTPAERRNYWPRLLQLYQDDPDPGIHGAAEWLLRKWGGADQLNDIEKRLATGKVEAKRHWYINRQKQIMVVIENAGVFWMGEEKGLSEQGNKKHRMRIGRSFSIASKGVTVAQFRAIMKPKHLISISPTPECPVNNVTWYEAAEYCNRLSMQENIPEKEWCYIPNKAGEYKKGMEMAPNYLQRTGYRLPTEAEWEFSCRAGSEKRFSFGEAEDVFGKYGWYFNNASGTTHPVGTLKPNDLGLFDMHGNIWQWCQDTYKPYPEAGDSKIYDDKGDEAGVISDKIHRVLRGGDFSWHSWNITSAYRYRKLPTGREGTPGIRPARTLHD